MKLKLTKSLGEYLGEERLRGVGVEWRSRSYEDFLTIDLSDMTKKQITTLRSWLDAAGKLNIKGTRVLVRDIDVWMKAMTDAGSQHSRTVAQFASLITEYIRNVEGHRIYKRIDLEGVAHACFYVNAVKYDPGNKRSDNYIPPRAALDLLFYELGGKTKTTLSFQSEDIRGMTASEALAKAGYFVENPKLRKAYLEETKRFNEVAPLVGNQFYALGSGTDDLDGNPSGGGRYSRYSTNKLPLDNEKVVIDVFYEGEKEHRYSEGHINQTFWASAKPKALVIKEIDDDGMDKTEEEIAAGDGLMTEIEIPIHPFCAVFDLRHHLRMRVHINYLTEYVYDLNMGAKLILPQVTKDLVATLIEQSRTGFEDIIEGKGRGVCVLLGGPAGVGKTLTAEVFSEASEKPLYSIQAAQLGISSDKVEENLTRFLARGSRWNAIVLIDEADVYIRARDKDMEHNAIVASLLRVLEYQTAIMFMTTNLAETADDAIISRCIARINYHHPNRDEQAQIWRVLADLNSIALTDEYIAVNVKRHPTLAGRDIKQLLKLAVLHTAKSKKRITPDVIDFVAQFQPTIDNGNKGKQDG